MRTIFFHRTFTPITPATHDVLDVTLPYVPDNELEDLIETRATAFIRALDTGSTTLSPQYNPKNGGASRGTIMVQFLERKRRKGWFIAKADEETVWESWVIDVTLSSARSEPEGDGRESAECSHEGGASREQGEEPHTSDHDERFESVPISDHRQSEGVEKHDQYEHDVSRQLELGFG
jgi:hypothetical protein